MDIDGWYTFRLINECSLLIGFLFGEIFLFVYADTVVRDWLGIFPDGETFRTEADLRDFVGDKIRSLSSCWTWIGEK